MTRNTGVMRYVGEEIDRAFEKGATFEQFLAKIRPVLEKKRWWDDGLSARNLEQLGLSVTLDKDLPKL